MTARFVPVEIWTGDKRRNSQRSKSACGLALHKGPIGGCSVRVATKDGVVMNYKIVGETMIYVRVHLEGYRRRKA